MRDHFISDGLRLTCHVARPIGRMPNRSPGLVVCHGFPAGRQAPTAVDTYVQFADRLASEAGWSVMVFNFRGAGESEGNFSLAGWRNDLRAAIAHLHDVNDIVGVWLAGVSAGGSLALCEAADDPRIRGVASFAALADFDAWAADARGLLEHARAIGVVRDAGFPADFAAWSRELREPDPMAAVAEIPPRPILIVHGDEDDVVPVEDARALADASGGSADLRIIRGAGHRLRHDPRAVAVLLGWLERQQVTG